MEVTNRKAGATPHAGAVEKLKFTEKLGYGLGDAASNFYFQVFNIFLLYYYTDVFGLHPAAVGTMFLVTKAVDALSDPAMGLVADRTDSRWGKYRPYLLWAAVPYGLLGYAMFASPELSAAGKLIYAYATYSLMMLAYTAVNIPYSALMGVISPASDERVKVSAYRFFCAYGAAWLIGTFVTPLKNILGGGDEAEGFRLTMLLFSVFSIAMFWATFASTKERVQAIGQRPDLKADLKALMRNVPWLALFVSGVFALMQVAVRNGGILYYFKYYVGDDGTRLFWIFDSTAVFLSLGTFALILGVTCTRALTQHFEKQHLMIALTVLSTALSGGFFFLSPDQYGWMLALNCIGNFIAGPLAPLVFAMNADCADYGEWRSGRRTTALIYSGGGFAAKMGLAVGAGLAGYILALFGFVANQPQTETAMLGIRLMFTLFPAALSLIGAAAILFYKLDRATVATIEAELAERRRSSPIGQ